MVGTLNTRSREVKQSFLSQRRLILQLSVPCYAPGSQPLTVSFKRYLVACRELNQGFAGLCNQDIIPGDVVGVQGVGGLGHLAIQRRRMA